MRQQAIKLQIEAERAKCLYAFGYIEREEALAKIKPYIDCVNATAERIAKEFKMKPKFISPLKFLR